MVVVAVAQHDGIGAFQGDAEHVCIHAQGRSLAGVEEEAPMLGFDPHGQAVLGEEPFLRGRVFHQDRDPEISH